jgi:hypothetical protein
MRKQIPDMRKAIPPARFQSAATILGLVIASLACLCAGALVAVSYDGIQRLLFAGAGFCGYLYFFAHALRALALPAVLIESGPTPDGEFRKETTVQKSMEVANRRALRTAA